MSKDEWSELSRPDWIAKARSEFNPGEQQPCAICGKFRWITHAHHVIPLARQYILDAAIGPDHEYVWLCPNHHAMVHYFRPHCTPGGKRNLGALHDHWGLSDDEIEKIYAIMERWPL